MLVVLVLVAGGLIKMPDWFNKDRKRAEQSQQSTEQLLEAQRAQGSSAAAGVVQIAAANAMAPESPSKDFIDREASLILTKLPAPDARELAQAEARRIAVMEGRLEEANRLYNSAQQRADRLARDLAAATEARRAADRALAEAAAAKAAADRQLRILFLVTAALVGLWLYAKLHGIGPKALGRIAADIRQGAHPIAALDMHVPDYLKSSVRREAKLAQELKDE